MLRRLPVPTQCAACRPLRRAMASLGRSLPKNLQVPVGCYPHGPGSRGFDQSSLGVDPALERLAAPYGSRLPHLAAWTKDFFRKGMPDDEFAQFYKVYAARINPDRARVPTEHLEEFKTRAGASPEIWEIEEARACAPEARDVVPPAHAPSPPPSGSPSEPGDSTAEVRVRRRHPQP
jgi:hypothetical protein